MCFELSEKRAEMIDADCFDDSYDGFQSMAMVEGIERENIYKNRSLT